jgi:hypothetical protein
MLYEQGEEIMRKYSNKLTKGSLKLMTTQARVTIITQKGEIKRNEIEKMERYNRNKMNI